MSVKKQMPCLCKFYFSHHEIPDEFFEETVVDSYFYHILDISQSQHRIVRVSKGSNQNPFAIKLFQLCDIKTQQRSILQEEVTISERELSSVVDSLLDFLKSFDKASKCLQIS